MACGKKPAGKPVKPTGKKAPDENLKKPAKGSPANKKIGNKPSGKGQPFGKKKGCAGGKC